MGGIDEAALDRLSLVTQMTKHIRVRASGGKSTAAELAQFSPIFVWLLRIRDSIRALFPERECFTLVRPLNNENDLQRLDQMGVSNYYLDRLRPEFRAGFDAFTKFVFERIRPKQVGATMMTGPVLVGIIESYLDALNNGAVPTISSSWQCVEEAECQKAYDSAKEFYMENFDCSKPPEEGTLREAHEKAVQSSLAIFSFSAVDNGSARKKYEALLHNFFRKAFEDFKRTAFMQADLLCSNSIQSMEKRLGAACHYPDANVDNVIKVALSTDIN